MPKRQGQRGDEYVLTAWICKQLGCHPSTLKGAVDSGELEPALYAFDGNAEPRPVFLRSQAEAWFERISA